jgi:signal transduction histidine kinase
MPAKYKILFLEDNEFDIDLMKRELRSVNFEFESQITTDEKGFITAIRDFAPDIVLADYSLPQFNGMEAFQLLKPDLFRPAFIIVTGTLSEQMAFDCLTEGIDDFVLKSSFKRLPAAMLKAMDKRKAECESSRMAAALVKRNKELEQFAYVISHNLRGSVTSLQGLFNIWDPEKRDKNEQKYIYEGIKHSIEKLDEVIKDINFILQVKNNAADLKQLVKFSELVNDIKIGIYTLIKKENASIECDFNQVESITSIKTYLHSIFYNLILNSIKYRKPGEDPVIQITSRLTDTHIELHFTDNGIGIDLEKYGKKLFGLYKRFNEEVEGKGMGLFLVKTQVEALGGNIDVKSAPGKGCEFIIQLPIN